MPEDGHFQRMRSLVSGLADHAVDVHVLTHRKFQSHVEEAGGIFFDLFSRYPLELADDESAPVPSRFVTYAATYAEPIRRDVEALGPSLVIHDSFSVIGRVTASLLGIPRVNVCAGHNVVPARFLAALGGDPRVNTSSRCLHAVKVLRDSYGMADASPFSYVSSLSPDFNIYCEPPEFLEEDERQAIEPVAFYGSIPSLGTEQPGAGRERSCFGPGSHPCLKIYVSFGTVVWRYYADDALRALTILSAAFAGMTSVRAVISLGGATIDREARAGLTKQNVLIEDYLDQWRILRESDIFFTHHGMNSTHEAIFHRVPMVSYPFFWDQPGLARKCQAFGLAIPLADSPRGRFGRGDVRAAVERLACEKESMQQALSRALEWEMAVMANRPAVLQRVIDLID
jgi:UDP:flavonoid glycosyltransferase YjiC (YdhE family)